MQPESLVQLVGSGNVSTVESEWMRIVETPDVAVSKLADYHVVLSELRKVGNTRLAETLAWAGLEAAGERNAPLDVLRIAGPFLLGVGESEDLRKHVADLYRQAYPEQESLDSLLNEAGLPGGRPVRRALRTLEVCLTSGVGGFLIGRDEDTAAAVEDISFPEWTFTIRLDGSRGPVETLDPVTLADRYEVAPPDDWRVMKRFHPEGFQKQLQHDPSAIVLQVCRRNGDVLESDMLESVLVPAVIEPGNWKKWWTRVRTSLKHHPHLSIEGRSPYVIRYTDKPVSLEDSMQTEFAAARDPLDRFVLVERYLRDCKQKGMEPNTGTLSACQQGMVDQARRTSAKQAATGAIAWVLARRISDLTGLPLAEEPETVELFRRINEPASLMRRLGAAPLVDVALRYLRLARPTTWSDEVLAALPELNTEACDCAATRLVESGRTPVDFEQVVERILAMPAKHFDALLWLWNGPSVDLGIKSSSVSLLMKILRTLDEAKAHGTTSSEMVKWMSARARSVLPARRYARFRECLPTLEPAMALALKRQVNRCEGLSRVIRDEMTGVLADYTGPAEMEKELPYWAREDILYVTDAGLSRKHDEIDQHVNVKMKENARAIGRAAEHGDLSENSEYKFALEERDLLRARLAQMNAEVNSSKVIRLEDVPEDHIGVGTRAVFRRQGDSSTYEMTFLGPWEADASRGVFNYKAPLCQKLMGKRVGDLVDLEHGDLSGTYELVALHNALSD